MIRKRYFWKLRDREIVLGDRTLIMGILNVTPDSFSDGGLYNDPDRAYGRALQLEEAGADMIDIGAESSRPGAQRITEVEETHRLVPVLKRLRGKLAIPISVDTSKAAIAEKSFDLGAEVINDASGFTFDPLLGKAVGKYNGGFILNHMRGTPDTWAKLPPLKDPMGAVVTDLEASVHRCLRAGIDRVRLMLDPGLGFGKRKEENATLLARLPLLARLDLPILVGPSRKSFLKQKTENETAFAGSAAVCAAILGGAHMVRVHDVTEMAAAARIADAVLQASAEQGVAADSWRRG